jgi:uncharacterized membrane protein
MHTSATEAPPSETGFALPRWIPIATWVLVLAGLAISSYLTVAHYDHGVTLICSKTATIDCESVTTSKYSELFGIPLPLFGLLFFLAIGALNLPFVSRSRQPILRWAPLACTISGTLFVVYLVVAEVMLGKICLWCTGVHALTVLLFVLTLIGELHRIGQSPR